MRFVKWVFWAVVWILIGAFLHYTLPQHDIVRVTDTFERRVDFGRNAIFWAQGDAGTATNTVNRDVFFIQAIQSDGDPMVYRNEDTGWGWPPYFKFNTNNLQARAADVRSTRDNPQWVAITHYGWRNELLTTFPNAVGIRPVAGPDVRIIPWASIVILVVFFALAWAIGVRWRRFRHSRLDPMMDRAGDRWYERRARMRERFGPDDQPR